jgi:hypothetical protein
VCANEYISFPCSDYSSALEAGHPEPTTGDPTPGPDEANDAEDVGEGEGHKILSKKEKERLKKEKEKVNFIRPCVTVTSEYSSLLRQRKRPRRPRRRPNRAKRRQ